MRNNTTWKRMALGVAGAFLLAQPAIAQDARHITMQEAIDLSLNASKTIKISNVRVAQAIESTREAKDKRLPDASISGSYLRLTSPTIKLPSSSDTSGGSGNKNSFSDVNSAMYGIASVSLPLYSGGRISAGIESARYLEQATKLDAENDREAVVMNTINAYSNLYKAKEAVALVQENLKQADQRVNDFSRLEQNGLLARNDLLKAELQSSNVQLTLLDAQNNFRTANINMNLMLGLPEETVLDPDTTFLFTPQDQTALQWENDALTDRKDLQATTYRRQAAEAGVKAAKGEYYPSLALSGGYVAAYVPHLLTVYNAVNFGVGLSYSPSSLWKSGTHVQQAKLRVQEAELNTAQLNDNVRLQVTQAYENYLLSQKKIDVYSKAVEQAQENYRITNNKYTNSLATTTDLLDADVAQLQAELNYQFSKADAAVSYNKLLQTAGQLPAGAATK